MVTGYHADLDTHTGEKVRTYTCCSRPVADGGGCSHGPHVFYDTEPALLHSRHAFSFLQSPTADQDGPSTSIAPSSRGTTRNVKAKLDVAALDCEMVYTTGGMRVARVSVIDGTGKEVFDELIKMDEGVEVVYVPCCPSSLCYSPLTTPFPSAATTTPASPV